MDALKLFATLNAKQFATDARYFASDKRAEIVTRFRTFAVNCVHKVFEHGDVKWANKASAAAELCGFGPTFRRCFVPNVPFKYDKEAKIFDGSIQQGKRNALAALNEDGVLKFEADIVRRLADEGQPREKKEADYEKRLINSVKAALKHGIMPQAVKKLVSETISTNITTVNTDQAKKAA